MKKSIVSFLVLCIACTLTAQHKKLIVGEWVLTEVSMEGQLLFNRLDKEAVFASFKKMTFGDSALSLIDSLALVETVQEAEQAFSDLRLTFTAKGNYTESRYDVKGKKKKVNRGKYRFAPNSNDQLLLSISGTKPTDHLTIIELSDTKLALTDSEGDKESKPATLIFERVQIHTQKRKPYIT